MARITQWEDAFSAWVESAQRRPFEWGRFDCALMAASCVEAITGTHPAPELVGSYYTPLGAARVLTEHDGLSGLCDARFKRTKSPQRGDIHLCRFGRKETLAIDCQKQILMMGLGRPRLVHKGMVESETAWRVE